MDLELREKFPLVTRDRPWSDVKEINWHNNQSMSEDLLSMDHHCKYKFVAHTRGEIPTRDASTCKTCRSVIVAHTMDWIQHYQHLMVPSGPEKYCVRVRREFSDLDQKMRYLVDNPSAAQNIADKSVETFRERYLTSAAEALLLAKPHQGVGEHQLRAQAVRRWGEATGK